MSKEAYWPQEPVCPYCGVELTKENRSKDHIISRQLGNRGTANIVLACAPCNRLKGDMTPAALEALATDSRTFADRLDRMAATVRTLMQERGLSI